MSQEQLPPGGLNHPSNYGQGPTMAGTQARQFGPPAGPPGRRPGWLRWVLVAVGVLALLGIGGVIGASSQMTTVPAAAPPVTVTVTATAKITAPTVKVTVTNVAAAPDPVTVTAPAPAAVTVTAEAGAAPAAAGGGAAGPFSDGTYLIGSDIQAGNYKCSGATDNSRWIIEDSAGETLDIDFSAVARVPADGYTVQFKECPNQWEKIG